MILRTLLICVLLMGTVLGQDTTPPPTTFPPSTSAPTTLAPTTVAPTTATPTTVAPTTATPTTTKAPTTATPSTQAPVTQAPSTQAPVTQAPSTQAPTTATPTTAAPTTPVPTTAAPTLPPAQQKTLTLSSSSQGILLDVGRTQYTINMMNGNGSVGILVTFGNNATKSRQLTIAPGMISYTIPAPATLIPLITSGSGRTLTTLLSGITLDADQNSGITEITLISPPLSSSALSQSLGLFAFDNAEGQKTYSFVGNVQQTNNYVFATLPLDMIDRDVTFVFASYPSTPIILPSDINNNITSAYIIGNLNTTFQYESLSIRVASNQGNQLTIERIYGLSNKQEQARVPFGIALIYYRIRLNDIDAIHETQLTWNFSPQNVSNAGLRSDAMLRWAWYDAERDSWVQSGASVVASTGVITTATPSDGALWGVFSTGADGRANSAVVSKSSVITVFVTMACAWIAQLL